MDITTCLSEWYKITDHITPRSKSEELRMRMLHRCYFNQERLMEHTDRLTKLYGTGECLFDDRVDDVRARHVFVAAPRAYAKGYNLFRTYAIPRNAFFPNRLLEGPEEPMKFHISRAFNVTGAAKYLSPPCHEQMKSGRTFFSDSKFPDPHDITGLALDEMWGLYGARVPLSVVVNIGPGLPSKCDLDEMASRLSWVLTPSSYGHLQQRSTPLLSSDDNHETDTHSCPGITGTNARPGHGDNTVRSQHNFIEHDSARAPADKEQQPAHPTGSGSDKHLSAEYELMMYERAIDNRVKAKLDEIYPRGSELYYRLAPETAPKGTVRNDSLAPSVVPDATNEFLELPVTKIKIDQIVERMRNRIL